MFYTVTNGVRFISYDVSLIDSCNFIKGLRTLTALGISSLRMEFPPSFFVCVPTKIAQKPILVTLLVSKTFVEVSVKYFCRTVLHCKFLVLFSR